MDFMNMSETKVPSVQSILNNPKYGPRSELGTNMFTYLKFGLPRVLPPGKGEQVHFVH